MSVPLICRDESIRLTDLAQKWADEVGENVHSMCGHLALIFENVAELPPNAITVSRLSPGPIILPPKLSDVIGHFRRNAQSFGEYTKSVKFSRVYICTSWLGAEFHRQGLATPSFLQVCAELQSISATSEYHKTATHLPAVETGDTPSQKGLTKRELQTRASFEVKRKEMLAHGNLRGAKRRIVEIWEDVEKLHPGGADGTQVLRILMREKGEQQVEKKTVQNHLCSLRKAGLIP